MSPGIMIVIIIIIVKNPLRNRKMRVHLSITLHNEPLPPHVISIPSSVDIFPTIFDKCYKTNNAQSTLTSKCSRTFSKKRGSVCVFINRVHLFFYSRNAILIVMLNKDVEICPEIVTILRFYFARSFVFNIVRDHACRNWYIFYLNHFLQEGKKQLSNFTHGEMSTIPCEY